MFAVQIDTRDLAKIKEVPKKITSARGLMSALGQYMASSTQRKIEKGVEPENAPLTKAWKKGGALTLRDTGKYRASITSKADSTKAVVGTNAVQGAILQKGGTIKPKKAKKLYIPAGWKARQMMRKGGMDSTRVYGGDEAGRLQRLEIEVRQGDHGRAERGERKEGRSLRAFRPEGPCGNTGQEALPH